MSQVDFAYYAGIKSVPIAAVFAAIYAPLAAYYVWRTLKNVVLALFLISLFCFIRVTAFGMRAYVASSDSAQHTQGTVVATMIVYSIGFFGLLNSVYYLQIERASANSNQQGIFHRISGNGVLIHLILMGAVVLSIVGTTDSYSSVASTVNRGKTFKIISAVAYVTVSLLLVVRCVLHLKEHGSGAAGSQGRLIGEKHCHQILLLVALVFTVREGFLVATTNNSSVNKKEAFFYILEAVPELIGVCLLAAPGLIPPKYSENKEWAGSNV